MPSTSVPRAAFRAGIRLWPDCETANDGGIREAFRELGRRLAKDFDPPNRPVDRELYARVTKSCFAAGAIERDAEAYVAYLSVRPEIPKGKKLGVVGYCLGGMCFVRTAALLPDRIGGASCCMADSW